MELKNGNFVLKKAQQQKYAVGACASPDTPLNNTMVKRNSAAGTKSVNTASGMAVFNKAIYRLFVHTFYIIHLTVGNRRVCVSGQCYFV